MIAWAVETFVATTMLMGLVLLLRAPVRAAFGPHVAYALWLLPVARLMLPPLPERWTEQASAPVAAVGEAFTYYVIETAGEAPAGASGAVGVDWLMLAGGVWLAGALAFLAYHLIAHGRFCRRLLRAARIDRTVAQGRVRVIETDAAHGPLAFGVWRKYVAFPRDFSERYDEVERDLALAHELGHHVRGDLIANWVALIVLALHWFNPVAWRAFRAFRADQEMACDALVLAGRAQALRHAYGRAIVKSAHGGAVSAACHLHTINELKGRLRMLSKTTTLSPGRIAAGVAGTATLSLAALALTASGTQAAERITQTVEETLSVATTAIQDVPPAPATPERPAAPPASREKRGGKVERHVYTVRSGDGEKDGRRVVVVRTSDGPMPHAIALPHPRPPHPPRAPRVVIDGVPVAMPEVPEVVEAKCRERQGDRGQVVLVEPGKEGKRQRIMVCTNRIERIAIDAKAAGETHRRNGTRHAIAGLRHARAAVQADPGLSPEDKAEALKNIDEAIAEVEQIARK